MAVPLPHVIDDEFEYGVMHDVSPLIRRIVAKNPNRFTFRGTGTYIVGRGKVAVIDPGPNLPEHIDAILSSLAAETITHIFVTHTHSDHSPGSRPLQSACGAEIYGFGPLVECKDEPAEKVEEDIDTEFRPNVYVKGGEIVKGEGWTMECLHTPGHISNHVCYRLKEENSLFTGDHVMGWSTSVIIPPDGNMSDYISSLKKLLESDDQVYYPTHGPKINHPKPLLEAYIQHRYQREKQVIEYLDQGFTTIDEIVPLAYKDTDPALHGAASRSLYATLIKLVDENRVICTGKPRLDSKYQCLP